MTVGQAPMQHPPQLHGALLALNIGAVGTLRTGAKVIDTAYLKDPVTGPLPLGPLGFPGDEHVYRHHGGPDKAVCVYPHEHYRYWQDRLHLELPPQAAFGENFTVTGLVERDVELGDVFTVGTAVVQVTQPRAPCYKIAARYSVPKMALYVQQEGMTGFLMRVLTPGDVQAGQRLTLISRQGHGMTVHEANRILNADTHDVAGARRMLRLPDLPELLIPGLERRIARHAQAADRERLFGEDAPAQRQA